MKTRLLSMTRRLSLVVSLAALFVMFGTVVSAQKQGGGMGYGNASPEDRAKRQTEMMKEKLALNTAQESKVSAINLKYARKMEDVRKITDTAAQRKSFESFNKQKDGELKTVLTPDQFKSYQKQMEELKARRKGMTH